jgi:peptidoglycan-associated lipoprotein
MKNIKTLSILLAASALLAGCNSVPLEAPVTTVAPVTPVAPSSNAGSIPAALSTVTSVVIPAYLDPQSDISKNRSIYFAYDDFSIKSDYNGLVERHAKYLVSNPALSIKIEGNADERGGSEYNLALGQKRAEAAQRALLVFGVKAAQVESVSWGKEKPKALGHDEAAWAENRRADLQYPKK